MPFVRLLPDRWQKFVSEAAKFGVVGGINTVINYAVFNALALTIFANGQLKATVIATIVATITSYLMNRHWTYRDRPKSAMRREYALFFLFNATGLAIELGVLALAKYGLGFHGLIALNIAKTIGVVLATLFRFWSYRTFVFRPVPAAAASSAPDPADPTAAAASAGTPGDATDEPDATSGPPERPARPKADDDPAETEPARPAPAKADADTQPADARPAKDAGTGETPHIDFTRLTTPLERELANPIDVEFEAELAAELDAASRRPASR
ncbi:GtrA family protein [Polymorphospora sp. NPDC050346]|uniref:GtrA family protein n=1 Tax=Polymorphospora sp. NPDC050346 TaxID=3155780 RepID=UPI0033E4E7FE